VLVGLMGTGKSTVGRILATQLGRPFVDTDTVIALEAARSIAEIFTTEGEAAFRTREAAVIARLSSQTSQVIATGGGAVLALENREQLRKNGLVIWLDATPDELLRRVIRQSIGIRPLLAGPDPLGSLQALAAARNDLYGATAHHRIDTTGQTPQATAGLIMAWLSTQPI
jgi:shikimate kinase